MGFELGTTPVVIDTIYPVGALCDAHRVIFALINQTQRLPLPFLCMLGVLQLLGRTFHITVSHATNSRYGKKKIRDVRVRVQGFRVGQLKECNSNLDPNLYIPKALTLISASRSDTATFLALECWHRLQPTDTAVKMGLSVRTCTHL